MILDLILAGFIALMGYVIAGEGLWGAALMLVNVVVAGLLAFDFYEMLAPLIANNISALADYADFLSIIGIFTAAVLILRLVTDNLGPTMVRFKLLIYNLGRYAFGFWTAFVLAAILLCAVETLPLDKQFLGYSLEKQPLFGVGLDRYWLGFVQRTSELIFPWGEPVVFEGPGGMEPPRLPSDFVLYYYLRRTGEGKLPRQPEPPSTSAGSTTGAGAPKTPGAF